MALSDDKLWDLWNAQGTDDMSCAEAFVFARAIEAEARRDALEEAAAAVEKATPTPQADSQPALLKECLSLLESFDYEDDEDSQSKAFFKAHINVDWFFHVKNLLERAARAPADSVLEDAARYRFLARHCRSTSEHWGGRWSIVVDGPAPKSHDSEDDFDAAIDSARKKGANHD